MSSSTIRDSTRSRSQYIGAGKSAGFAWRSAVAAIHPHLAKLLDDARLRERADDLLDIESHVLLALAGEARPMLLPLPEQAVLIADDLLPSELTALDRSRLAGICLSGGGATSHVAILAAAMEIPMLVGARSARCATSPTAPRSSIDADRPAADGALGGCDRERRRRRVAAGSCAAPRSAGARAQPTALARRHPD